MRSLAALLRYTNISLLGAKVLHTDLILSLVPTSGLLPPIKPAPKIFSYGPAFLLLTFMESPACPNCDSQSPFDMLRFPRTIPCTHPLFCTDELLIPIQKPRSSQSALSIVSINNLKRVNNNNNTNTDRQKTGKRSSTKPNQILASASVWLGNGPIRTDWLLSLPHAAYTSCQQTTGKGGRE